VVTAETDAVNLHYDDDDDDDDDVSLRNEDTTPSPQILYRQI
jgi:hypothetical protein